MSTRDFMLKMFYEISLTHEAITPEIRERLGRMIIEIPIWVLRATEFRFKKLELDKIKSDWVDVPFVFGYYTDPDTNEREDLPYKIILYDVRLMNDGSWVLVRAYNQEDLPNESSSK